MFQDAMLLKTQLFHSIWPNVDIIGYADYANSSADYSQGANGAYNYAPVSSESQVAWNYGANFGGPTKSSWTSGADAVTAGNYPGKDLPNANGGAYGVFFVADPSYSTSDGGYGGSTDYPQNGNYVVSMCHDADATCRG